MDHGHSFLYSSTPPQHFSPSFLIYIPCHWLALFPHISFTSAQATRRTRSILKCTHQLAELTPLKQSLFHLTAVHHTVENAWRWQFLSCFFFLPIPAVLGYSAEKCWFKFDEVEESLEPTSAKS